MAAGLLREFLQVSERSLIALVVLFILARIMGKKQIAQLTFFDYVAGISIGSLAAAFAVDDRVDYGHGLVSMVVFATLPIVMSYWGLKSLRVREWVGGTPTILIQHGKLVEQNLRHARFHVNDVLEECRIKGAFSIADVDFAVLETSGRVSIMLKPPRQPVTGGDIGLTAQHPGLTADLIIDGTVLREHLALIGKDETWLRAELVRQGVSSPREVLLATTDATGQVRVDLKGRDPQVMRVFK